MAQTPSFPMHRLLSFLLFLPAAALAAPDTPRPPDVLVILTDQWSPRYVSWDNPQVRTPNLDQIAKEGMIFDACYTTSPVCMPARVSLVTGLYPHNQGHALWGNAAGYLTDPKAAPMFHDMKRAGYTTAKMGKFHWTAGSTWKERYPSMEDYYRAMGLDETLDISGPPDDPKARGPYARHLREQGLLEKLGTDMHDRYVKWEFEPRASVVPVEHYHDTFVTRAAVDFIGRQPKEKPLCLVVSLHSPHPPLDAPGEFATMHDPEKLSLPGNVPAQFFREGHLLRHADVKKMLANYLGKIALADHCMGMLVEAMKQRGTWENTLVAFTADHGEMMGAHGALTKGRFYEESVRVPLVLRWPGHIQTGRTKALAQMCDVYPTVVEAAGGEVTPGRFAKSLLPVAMGKEKTVRGLVISEIGGATPPLRMMARDERFKWWADEDTEYLFDLEADPLEETNLAARPEHKTTLEAMRNRMLTFLRNNQTNLAAGYKPKVQRMREAAGNADAKKGAPKQER